MPRHRQNRGASDNSYSDHAYGSSNYGRSSATPDIGDFIDSAAYYESYTTTTTTPMRSPEPQQPSFAYSQANLDIDRR